MKNLGILVVSSDDFQVHVSKLFFPFSDNMLFIMGLFILH